MKFETTAGMLLTALRPLRTIVVKRTHIPVLDMVKLDDGRIEANDLDIVMSVPVAHTDCDGAVLLPYWMLWRLISAAGDADEVVRISARDDGEGRTELRMGAGTYYLPRLPLEDWPALAPDAKDWQEYDVDGAALREAVRFAIASVSTEETRYYLNGVFLYGGAAVATNGHRLGYSLFQRDGTVPKSIVPTRLAGLLSTLPPVDRLGFAREKPDQDFRIIRFESAGIRVTGRLIDGNFPDYWRVIPDPAAAVASIALPRVEVLRCLQRFAALGCQYCILVAEGGRLAIGGTSEGALAGVEALPLAAGSAEFTMGFGTSYLRSIFTMFDAEALRLELHGDAAPIRIECAEQHRDGIRLQAVNQERFGILMPARINSMDMDAVRAAIGLAPLPAPEKKAV